MLYDNFLDQNANQSFFTDFFFVNGLIDIS